jgi:hypothetical protein
MALTTLNLVKIHLGIADTSQDALLTQLISGGSAAVRQHCQHYLYGAISSASVANPTQIVCPGHGLESGQAIVINGCDALPSINGSQTVTVIDQDNFSLPVSVTTAGTKGTFARTYTEYYSGNGKPQFVLRESPVSSISSLYFDPAGYYGDQSGGFADSTQLTEGVDFVLKRDRAAENECSYSGIVVRINGEIWHRPAVVSRGLMALSTGDPFGNIKVTYTAGYSTLPTAVVLATNQIVAQLRRNAVMGGPVKQESYLSEASYVALDVDLESQALGSVRNLLRPYKKYVW